MKIFKFKFSQLLGILRNLSRHKVSRAETSFLPRKYNEGRNSKYSVLHNEDTENRY